MRGNEHAALVGFKHHFKEMLAIEAKDRTPSEVMLPIAASLLDSLSALSRLGMITTLCTLRTEPSFL